MKVQRLEEKKKMKLLLKKSPLVLRKAKMLFRSLNQYRSDSRRLLPPPLSDHRGDLKKSRF